MNKKEILITVGVIVLLILLMIIGGLVNKINSYEEKLSKLNDEYVEIVAENNNLKDNIDSLNENIYNLFEKKPYKLSIEHNDERITYQQDKFGLFDSYYRVTSY